MFKKTNFHWLLLLPLVVGCTAVAAGDVVAKVAGAQRIDEPNMQVTSPESIAGATTIDPERAKLLFNKGVIFIDVRKSSDWEAGRVPGAVHLDLDTSFDDQNLALEVGKDEEVVIYCNGPKCLRSSTACAKAVAWGYRKVYYFRDGFPGWQTAEFPVE